MGGDARERLQRAGFHIDLNSPNLDLDQDLQVPEMGICCAVGLWDRDQRAEQKSQRSFLWSFLSQQFGGTNIIM